VSERESRRWVRERTQVSERERNRYNGEERVRFNFWFFVGFNFFLTWNWQKNLLSNMVPHKSGRRCFATYGGIPITALKTITHISFIITDKVTHILCLTLFQARLSLMKNMSRQRSKKHTQIIKLTLLGQTLCIYTRS